MRFKPDKGKIFLRHPKRTTNVSLNGVDFTVFFYVFLDILLISLTVLIKILITLWFGGRIRKKDKHIYSKSANVY